jgi:hypothetical protein
MASGNEYREEAARCEQRARIENDPTLKARWQARAARYYRLAALPDKNDKGGLLIDFSLPEKPLDS